MSLNRFRRRQIATVSYIVVGLFILSLVVFSLQWEINDVFRDDDYGLFSTQKLFKINFNLLENENEYGEDDIVDDSEDDYDYEYDNTNPDFKDGDFDVIDKVFQLNVSKEISGQVESYRYNVERKLQSQLKDAKSGRKRKRYPLVVDGIFWSQEVEEMTPKGISDKEVEVLSKKYRSMQIISVQPPSWDRCGRPKNQFVTLSDGSHMCARYRSPHNYLIQGEVLSFHLARLLGIFNLPVVVLSQLDRYPNQWSSKEIQNNITSAGWSRNGTIALIQWITHLERDKMPVAVLNALMNKQNLSEKTLNYENITREQTVEILQWSDLVVFDYITANYDRVASMQDAAERESKPKILSETIHNLVKSTKTGGLWLIDNESGLIDAYNLLYSQNEHQGNLFSSYHQRMLSTFCVFRRSLFDKISFLRGLPNPAKFLQEEINKKEPLIKLLTDLSNDSEFCNRFRERVIAVYQHMIRCKGKK